MAGFLGPSTEELEADLTNVRRQIVEADKEASKYKGGLLLVMIRLRVETLKNTEAMLEQKRLSIVRAILLNHTIDGKPQPTVSAEELSALEDDIKALEAEINKQTAEAAIYSGGLIKVMKLSAIETSRVTLATLKMRYLTAKHGIPIFGFEGSGTGDPPRSEEKPGRVVEDKEAL